MYNLKQHQLKHLLFPLGDLTKDEVRKLAKKFKLPVAEKPDSQEICFVGKSHYDFLKKYLKLKKGKIISFDAPTPSDFAKSKIISPSGRGRIIGEHCGLALYTLGQRSHIGLSGGPWYVSGLNRKKNQLIVVRDQKAGGIFRKKLACHKVNWVVTEPKFPLKCRAQIRYHGKSANCVVHKKGRGDVRVGFKTAQRAIMPGQSVVFYQGEELLGGGVIK